MTGRKDTRSAKQRDALVRVLGFHHLKETIKPGTNHRHLFNAWVGVGVIELHTSLGRCLPHLGADHVDQVIVAGILILQLGQQIAFKGTGAEFYIRAPVILGAAFIELGRTITQGRAMDGAHHVAKSLHHLQAHALATGHHLAAFGLLQHITAAGHEAIG